MPEESKNVSVSSARSELMGKVRQKNTNPEIVVRRLLHRLGFRFRIHRNELPGTPDIVMPKYKLCIFVHGCFWHRHLGCRLATTPKTNAEFWREKFEKNVERDAAAHLALKNAGWRSEVIWECETRDQVALERKLLTYLTDN